MREPGGCVLLGVAILAFTLAPTHAATGVAALGPPITQAVEPDLVAACIEKEHCPPLESPRNGSVSHSGVACGKRVATFKCDKGYRLVGSRTRICYQKNKWRGDPVRCEPDTGSCSNLGDPGNGTSTAVKQKVYKCLPGYHMVGIDINMCSNAGYWFHRVPLCKPDMCCDPPDVKGASHNGITPDQYKQGHVILYICEGNRTRNGAETIKCDKEQWTKPPTCDKNCLVGKWSDFGECRSMQGESFKRRTRRILQKPEGHGQECPELEQEIPCLSSCGCKYGKWSTYSECSTTCGPGLMTRTRDRAATQPDGARCTATAETQTCNKRDCGCKYSEWSDLTSCSSSCGAGTKTRTRTVTQSDGDTCTDTMLTETCKLRDCEVFCRTKRVKVGKVFYNIQPSKEDIKRLNNTAATIVLVVDESGSMETGHELLRLLVPQLERSLRAKGIGTKQRNNYGMVGFGGLNSVGHMIPHYIPDNSGRFFVTVDRVYQMRARLFKAGNFEDGYLAIEKALEKASSAPGRALNIILITNERRDTRVPGGEHLSASAVKKMLNRNGALLDVVVNQSYACGDREVLGITRTKTEPHRYIGYAADGGGGYTTCDVTRFYPVTPYVQQTRRDYVDPTVALGGGAWDFHQLKDLQDPFTASPTIQSFTKAFVDFKTDEITEKLSVCQKCWCRLDAAGDSGKEVCREHVNQPECRCLAQGGLFNQADGSCMIVA